MPKKTTDIKMTKKVNLVLISSLILNGCSHHVPQQSQDEPDQQTQINQGIMPFWYFHNSPMRSTGYTSGGSRVSSTSSGFRPSTGAGFRSSPSVSSRGGFGMSGRSFGAVGG